MTEHPNATLVRRAMDAFKTGDFSSAADVLADDVVWHTIGGATLHGRDEIAGMYGTGASDWEIDFDIHDVVANDEHAVALVQAVGRRGGKELRYRTAEILHVRDGRVTERWAFAEDTQAIADFFGG